MSDGPGVEAVPDEGPPHDPVHTSAPDGSAAAPDTNAGPAGDVGPLDAAAAPELDATLRRDLTLLIRIEAELDGVDAVLRRLEDADFARCGHCGTPIAPEVVAEDPFTSRCPAHPAS